MYDIAFRNYLNLLMFYLCPRCGGETLQWHPPDSTMTREKNAGGFHHKGAFINALEGKGHWSASDIIEATSSVYRSVDKEKVPLENEFIASLDAEAPPAPSTESFFRGLRRLAEYSHETFIRHGVERPRFADYRNGASFPTKGSQHEWGFVYERGVYAIDTDVVPFNGCSSHYLRGGVDRTFAWSYCAGYIPLSLFQERGGKLIKTDEREHYYAKSEIPVEEWIFVWDPIGFNRAVSAKDHDFKPEAFVENISALRKTDAALIELQTLKVFFHAYFLLKQKLEISQVLHQL